MSKLQTEALKDAISQSQVVAEARDKNRRFTETIELQIGLKNYDPQKDNRFNGSVKLPHIPRPMMKVCMLCDAQHVEEADKIGLDYLDVESKVLLVAIALLAYVIPFLLINICRIFQKKSLKRMNKNKKLAKKYRDS